MADRPNRRTVLEHWSKMLKTVASSGDFADAEKLMKSVLDPDNPLNPIEIVRFVEDRSIIPQIVRVMRYTEGLDAQTIAQRLVNCYCDIKFVVNATDVDVVEHMIRLGAPVAPISLMDAPVAPISLIDDRRRNTALHEAVKHGDSHLPLVRLLLDRGARVNCVDTFSNTPLLCCLDAPNSLETLRLLIARGARADHKGSRRREPLFRAVSSGQPLEAVELLIRAGANVRARGCHGLSALQYAAIKRRSDVVEYLLDLDDDPRTRAIDDKNILHLVLDAPVEYLRYLLLACDFRIYSGSLMNPMCSVMRSYHGSSRGKREVAARKLRFSIASGLDVSFWHERKHVSAEDGLWMDAMVEQVAVREFLDQEVDARCARLIYGSSVHLSNVVACKSELAALMELRFYGELTLFNVLTDSDDRMRIHVHNEELVAAFRRVCEEEVFLIYRHLIVDRFDNFLYLHGIRSKALAVLDRTFRGVAVVVRQIAKHLSVRDLLKLSKFYEE